jgi:hypothetical protein
MRLRRWLVGLVGATGGLEQLALVTRGGRFHGVFKFGRPRSHLAAEVGVRPVAARCDVCMVVPVAPRTTRLCQKLVP